MQNSIAETPLLFYTTRLLVMLAQQEHVYAAGIVSADLNLLFNQLMHQEHKYQKSTMS